MSAPEIKSALVSALAGFAARPLPEAASALFASLG